MAFQKGFLRNRNLFNPQYLFSGILIGLLYSFLYYGLFFLTREGIRISSFSLDSALYVLLSRQEHFFYNFFFALFASVLGFYEFLRFTLSHSQSHDNKKLRFRQRHILNNQSFAKWTFLSAFTRFATVLGFLYVPFSLQFDLDLFIEFWWFLLFIPVVLFLNAWPDMVTALKGRIWKLFLITLLTISMTSILYAYVDFYNYQRLDDRYGKSLLYYSYHFDMPVSRVHSRIERKSLKVDVRVVRDVDNEPRIFVEFGKREIKRRNFKKFIRIEQNKFHEVERSQLIANLMVDKGVKLKVVNELKENLRDAELRQVLLSTGLANTHYPSYYPPFLDNGIQVRLWRKRPEFIHFLDSVETLDLSNKRIKIEESFYYRLGFLKSTNRVKVILDEQTCLLNGSEINSTELFVYTYDLFKKYQDTMLIIYEPDENITYGRYIEYLDAMYYAIEKLRNETSLKVYNKPFEEWYRFGHEYDSIRRIYPRKIVEWTPEEKRLMKLVERSGVR